MEREDLVRDELLSKLAGRISLESPSDDFTSKVMAGLVAVPAQVPVRKSFFRLMKSILPWVLLTLFILIFLLSSDIPYLSFVPGKEVFGTHIFPYLRDVFSGLANLFTTSKTLSITLALMASGGLLAGVDWLIRRRSVARHPAA